ncbi:hypothetical protein [Streptomyces sp. NBC_00078]|uniref:DUF7848 domain-containing protein n=1 Tax=Streptomyces sp. NBC_00078 TaxID=2975643 RepID=UPI0022522AB6|nr:hypothetical protein [Streptomyces sp. NBC_00078]MCX5426092.1 hypothetical protein [Streptomyces sp. NBC_00078]
MRAAYRFRAYNFTADQSTLPTYQAVCVTGDDADCGADSGPQESEENLNRWMAEHSRDTAHATFRRAQWSYVEVQPGAWR